MPRLSAPLLVLFLGYVASFGIANVAYGQDLFERNLHLGDQGEDVRRLQVFLNNHGVPVAKTGAGSLGHETTLFSLKTRQAVTVFQELHRASILNPTKLTRGTGNFSAATREVVNNLLTRMDKEVEQTPPTKSDSTQTSALPAMSGQLTYAIGGTVTGLQQPVQVRELSGEVRTIKPGDSASFLFTRRFAPGDRYQVMVTSAIPGSQFCYVSSNGSGTIANASIMNIQAQCTAYPVGDPFQNFAGHGTESHVLGGTVSGLAGTLVLETAAGDHLTLTTNGSFTFGSRVPNGGSYAVSVRTNPSGPDQTCTVTHGSGTMRTSDVADIAVDCVANTTSLSASTSGLALSVTGLSGAPSSGSPRLITITNTGGTTARGMAVSSPTWPAGTISSTTCGDTLAASGSCTITVTPGATATSDGTSPCSVGSAPVPGVVQVTADNAGTISTNVVVLGYGCIYQNGYVFSIDDTTPSTGSIGGTVAALDNQSSGMVWSSNSVDASSVSYDIVPGIGETSASTSSAPTFADFSTYTGATYIGMSTLSPGDFRSCDGATDGQCNTSNIVSFYNHQRTNYGVGGAPYTPVATPTPKSYYAAGLCDDYDSGDYHDWYLPAICELTVDYPDDHAETAGCGVDGSPRLQTMMQNLFLRGIGGFTVAQGIWSSSEYMYNNPETYAWNALVWPSAFPGGGDKSDLSQVRCVRSLTH